MNTAIVQGLAFAALLGLFGQALRALVGMKKQADESAKSGRGAFADFDIGRLVLSLVLGAAAGAAAWMGLHFLVSPEAADLGKGAAVFAVIFAGYSGADFIEGFVKRHSG